MLLQRPDPVVAHHADHVHAVPRERVELHAARTRTRRRRASARPACRGGRASPRARTPRRCPDSRTAPGRASSPAAKLSIIFPAYDTKSPPSPITIASRSSTSRAPRTAASGAAARGRPRAPPALPRAARSRPRAAPRSTPRCFSAFAPGRRAQVAQRRSRARRSTPPPPSADAAARARPCRSRRSPSDRRTPPPKPSRKSIGTPITSATSAPFSAWPRAREKNSSWSAGTHPRASPFRNTGIRSVSASSSSASSPWPQYRSVPAMITGRSAPRSSSAARSICSPSAAAAPCPREAGQPLRRILGLSRLHEHVVHREVDERRPAVRGHRDRERLVDEARDLRGRVGRRRELRQRPHERHVVDLLQRAHPPAPRRRAAAEHEHRRVVLLRARDRADPVRHARPRRQRAHARFARHLRPALGRERRRRLVPHVDDLDPLLLAAVVDREQVPAESVNSLLTPCAFKRRAINRPPWKVCWSPCASVAMSRLYLLGRCPGWDSNPHTLCEPRILSPLRIPIPPPGPRAVAR